MTNQEKLFHEIKKVFPHAKFMNWGNITIFQKETGNEFLFKLFFFGKNCLILSSNKENRFPYFTNLDKFDLKEMAND